MRFRILVLLLSIFGNTSFPMFQLQDCLILRHSCQNRVVLRGGSNDNDCPEGSAALVLTFWEQQLPTLIKHVQNVLKTSDKILAHTTSALKGLQCTLDAQHESATQAWERFQKLHNQMNATDESVEAAFSEAERANKRLEGSLVMNLCSMLLVLRKAKALQESVDVINRLTDGGVMEELQEHVISLRTRSIKLLAGSFFPKIPHHLPAMMQFRNGAP
jgi:outer membrane murein-binding lipoprotein Lpp